MCWLPKYSFSLIRSSNELEEVISNFTWFKFYKYGWNVSVDHWFIIGEHATCSLGSAYYPKRKRENYADKYLGTCGNISKNMNYKSIYWGHGKEY